MKKWEYDDKRTNAIDFWSDLNKWGKEGWEAIHFTFDTYSNTSVIMKRELK